MKDYIETQYKNLDFTIPDDYVSRREVYAMLDYIGGADADEAFYQGWDAAIDEACSLLNDVDSAMGWTPVEEELPVLVIENVHAGAVAQKVPVFLKEGRGNGVNGAYGGHINFLGFLHHTF